ncbi:unnamed protein product, partial [Musa textilis]
MLLRAGIKACNKSTSRSLWCSVYFWEETLVPSLFTRSVPAEVHRPSSPTSVSLSPFLVCFCPICRPFGAALSRTLVFLG